MRIKDEGLLFVGYPAILNQIRNLVQVDLSFLSDSARSSWSLAISVTRQAGARRSQERAVFRARQASAWRVTETAILQE